MYLERAGIYTFNFKEPNESDVDIFRGKTCDQIKASIVYSLFILEIGRVGGDRDRKYILDERVRVRHLQIESAF